MTKEEFRKLKSGDKVSHKMYPKRIEIIWGDKTDRGFFVREKGSTGGWNLISEANCQHYDRRD